jgi:hypothetical protein
VPAVELGPLGEARRHSRAPGADQRVQAPERGAQVGRHVAQVAQRGPEVARRREQVADQRTGVAREALHPAQGRPRLVEEGGEDPDGFGQRDVA